MTQTYAQHPLADALTGDEYVPIWQGGARRTLLSTLLAQVPDVTLSPATTVDLGGIIVGDGLSVDPDGTLSATYELPSASDTVLGGVKVGAGLDIAGDGTLSVAAATVVSEAGTARTATPAHANDYTRFTNAAAKTYTFDAAQAYPVGSEYHGRNMGTGNLTLTAAGGMVLNAPNGGSLAVPINGAFTVKIVGVTEADVIGVTVAA